MTSDLILFENHEVRGIEQWNAVRQENEIWIPLADLASAWGIDRSTPDHIIERNHEVFAGLSATVLDVTSTTPVRCVNERGLYLMMGKVTAGRLKNKEAREAIIRFQRWVPELIQKYRKKEIVPAESKPQIKDEITRAKELAEATGGNVNAFMKIALERCGAGEYAPALDASSIVHGEKGWLNVSDLVSLCHDPLLNPERLNYKLANNLIDNIRHPFQYRDDNNLWRLTQLGKEHGKEYWYKVDKTGHEEIRIVWQKSILYAAGILKPVDPNQLALPGRAMS